MFTLSDIQNILEIGNKFIDFHVVEQTGEIIIFTGVKKDNDKFVLTDKSLLLDKMNKLSTERSDEDELDYDSDDVDDD